ncbi:MAG: hypothetical protein IPO78_08955 [Saprospiraceae bacterium]|nr:hypothetical protein [Saprospiraceae bacterium]MBK8450015.1 hypothetical protein [Saprospiraceae bacterium]MBK9221341.1 hypothetical protein [Saprospiraceae bacterium]MBK9721725.1 hypothetical protein [Saprospiraceae bacterium]MBK9728786.1 hypothetical protein [Saprospiraceae bacterium]
MKSIKYLVFLFLITFQSCDLTDEPAITGTAVQSMAGEWFLQLADATDGTLYVDYSMCTTSNTAANTADKMWFFDHDHFFSTQNKLSVNINDLSFSSDDDNLLYDATHKAPTGKPVVAIGTVKTVLSATPAKIKITNGKILKNAARPPSKTTTDSLYMLMTGVYSQFNYMADTYQINGVDTTVVWKLVSTLTADDGPYAISGYRRTGFLEDEH